jgi:DNA-binding MarR family transcriptional regulator
MPPMPSASADAVLSAARLLMAVSARSIGSVDESITLPQFRVLVVLSTQGALPLSAVAAQLGVSLAAARRLVDGLIASGLVRESAGSNVQRQNVVEMTESGAEIVAMVTRQRRDDIAEIIARIPDRPRSDWVAALRSFAEVGGEPRIPRPALQPD